MVIWLNEPSQVKKQGARLEKPKLSEPHLKSKRGTNRIMNSKNEQPWQLKMVAGTYLGVKQLLRRRLAGVRRARPDLIGP
jgi:hypothetical protein